MKRMLIHIKNYPPPSEIETISKTLIEKFKQIDIDVSLIFGDDVDIYLLDDGQTYVIESDIKN